MDRKPRIRKKGIENAINKAMNKLQDKINMSDMSKTSHLLLLQYFIKYYEGIEFELVQRPNKPKREWSAQDFLLYSGDSE